MPQDKLRRRRHAREVYPRLDAHPVQRIEQVFRREVARRAWRKRAAAQPARAGIENIHALLQRFCAKPLYPYQGLGWGQ